MRYSDAWSPAFPSDHRAASCMPEVQSHHSFYGINNNEGFQSFSGGLLYQQPYISDFADESCGFVEDVKPLSCPKASRENWGIQGNNQVLGVDQENIKVGRYSEEERKERILRYLRKRNQRNFNKTIKYACRKTLADRRVRVRGRFARNNELCEDEMTMKKEY
ncbi:zinc finger protein HD1-like [Neltuma alba]|uniref:zinc finger protein HD1-like n=1 Tax=Neltuma alba TaxID=207710 RepID=UPI0010A5424E|nr:zinc finger protein HD1-like [Prosopis alba]